MSERRKARGGTVSIRHVSTDALPPRLAIGPCIEDWTDPDEGADTAPIPSTTARAYLTLRRWTEEVEAWAEQSGWATAKRPPANACNLARVRIPWSREFLILRGERALVDWLEGTRSESPGRLGTGWQPLFGGASEGVRR